MECRDFDKWFQLRLCWKNPLDLAALEQKPGLTHPIEHKLKCRRKPLIKLLNTTDHLSQTIINFRTRFVYTFSRALTRSTLDSADWESWVDRLSNALRGVLRNPKVNKSSGWKLKINSYPKWWARNRQEDHQESLASWLETVLKKRAKVRMNFSIEKPQVSIKHETSENLKVLQSY